MRDYKPKVNFEISSTLSRTILKNGQTYFKITIYRKLITRKNLMFFFGCNFHGVFSGEAHFRHYQTFIMELSAKIVNGF